MINIEKYISELIRLLTERFGNRLLYVGLQGSYLRGEANDNSDIDIMAVIDGMCVSDLDAYRSVIQSLDYFDKSCGFICGREDFANWNPMEICHVLHTTKDYYGSLADLVPAYTRDDIRNFVKMSVNNLYHEICHRYVHAGKEASEAHLPGTYRGVFFILQNIHYLRSGHFAATKAELLALLAGRDKEVLGRALELGSGEPFDFGESFALLFSWCRETMKSI